MARLLAPDAGISRHLRLNWINDSLDWVIRLNCDFADNQTILGGAKGGFE
ncbi:MAG: hypothetical protein ABUS47_15075 [Steroidobacter sp.]